jgi:hypothetical protein
MMKNLKKLSLSRETLRALQDGALRNVEGKGVTKTSARALVALGMRCR